MLKNYADSGSAAFFKHGFTATSLRFIGPGLRPPRLHVFTKNLKNIDRIYSEQIGGVDKNTGHHYCGAGSLANKLKILP